MRVRSARDAGLREGQRGIGGMQVSQTNENACGAASEVGGTFDWCKGRGGARKRTRERPGKARRWH